MQTTTTATTTESLGDPVAPHSGAGQFYDVIEISADGTSLLGSSNLCTRNWCGYLSTFRTPDALGDMAQAVANLEFEGGLGCAKFLNNSKVLVGLDTGSLQMVNVAFENGCGPDPIASALEHDDVVSCMSTSATGTRAITGSFDRSLKVWHTDYLVCSHTYRPAHADSVLSVHIHPEQPDVMVSCSADGQVILWDLRTAKPALGIRRQFASRPSCASFLCSGRNLIIGTISGHLLQLDTASPHSLPLLELGAHKRSVHTIRTSEYDPLVVASCANDRTTVVASVDPTHPKILYCDERHVDLVRGLAWSNTNPKRLYSCGWDQQVIARDLC